MRPSYLHAEALDSESLPLNTGVKVGFPHIYLTLGVAAGPGDGYGTHTLPDHVKLVMLSVHPLGLVRYLPQAKQRQQHQLLPSFRPTPKPSRASSNTSRGS